MTKEEALQKIEELKIFIEQSPKKEKAIKFLEDFLKQEFTVKIEGNEIVYSLDGNPVFLLDIKDNYLWSDYSEIWKKLHDFGLKNAEIRGVIQSTVGVALNCKGFTTTCFYNSFLTW